MNSTLSFLRVDGKNIVDQKGRRIYLRGISVGAWLMMEGYFLHGRNIPAHAFKKEFSRQNSRKELENLLRLYRRNFINYSDIKRIKAMGANCLRVPFNYRLIYRERRWEYLDRVIKWCGRERIWCILDLHAAPGAQNPDWHSDSDGRALFWKEKRCQKLYFDIWRRIAQRYRNEPAIAGYDVLNEPVVDNHRTLSRIYQKLSQEIRKVDQHHIIFLEASHYGQKLRPLGRPKDKNTAYSIHVYTPINFTFNLQPHLRYPGYIDGKHWNTRRVYEMIFPYSELAEKWQVPIYVGEFGINYRSPKYYGELRYLQDALNCFRKFGFHWTYWTYKAIAGPVQPDGIFQYLPNSPWVRREGPVIGWENFYSLWKTHKGQISASWKTEEFTENKYLSSLLARYF